MDELYHQLRIVLGGCILNTQVGVGQVYSINNTDV